MTFEPTPARILALASAAGLLVLAGAFLILPRRDARARAFGAFAGLWALQVAAANIAASETSLDRAATFYALDVAGILPLYLPLAYFASAYPLRDGILSRSRLALALSCVPGVVAAGIMMVRPEWLVGTVVEVDGEISWVPGGLFAWIGAGPFVAALAYAVWRFGREARAGGTLLLSTRAALIATAFGTYLAYVTVGFLFYYGLTSVRAPTPLSIGYAAGYVIGLVALVLLTRDLMRSAWEHRGKALALLGLAGVFGLVENAFLITRATAGGFALHQIETIGFWRILMVGIVLYALARYQMFDLHARLGFRPRQASYVWDRKLVVYRAALEEALAKSAQTDEDRAWLVSLREGLDITEAEHRALEQSVRAALASGGRPALPSNEPELYRGRFKILRVLGGGGGGQAVLADDRKLGRLIVLKELGRAQRRDPSAVSALLHEASIMATIQHENVVRILEVDRSADDPALVIEYCDGGSVEDRQLKLGRPLPPEDIRRIMEDALRGLDAIHAKGLVHRDIKPANLLLTAEGRAKVADFGLAQTASHAPTSTTRGIDSQQPGTLPYMSPEQLRNPRIDRRSDLYSLAASCYHMATGRMHYGVDARDADEIREAILAQPSEIDAAPAWLREFLRKGLAKRRDARFQSAEEMLAALPAAPNAIARV